MTPILRFVLLGSVLRGISFIMSIPSIFLPPDNMKCLIVFSLIFGSIKTGFFYEIRYNPVDAVIFDMDGLLLNTEIVYFRTHSEIVRRFNKTYTKNLQLRVMGTQPKLSSKLIVDTLGLNTTPEAYRAEYEKLIGQRLYHIDFMPGAKKVIRHLSLHRIPMAVATSNTQKFFDILTDHHKNIFILFDHIVTGGSDPAVKHGKPAPDIFLICMDRFREHFKPHQILVLEDSPQGVLGARRAGMQVVMVPDPTLPARFLVNATKVLLTLRDFKPEEFGLPPYS